jgi:hypothetical protein
VFLACERLYSEGHLNSFTYTNSINWFLYILYEFGVHGQVKGMRANTRDQIKKENKLLSDYQNPFDQSRYPHTYLMFSLLLKLSEADQTLFKEILQPFMRIRRSWSQYFRKQPCYQLATSTDDGEYYQMAGSGTGKREIPPLDRSKMLKSMMEGFVDAFMDSPAKVAIISVPHLGDYIVLQKSDE